MLGLGPLDTLFVLFAFLIQIALIVYFALCRWAFATAVRTGWLIYALGVPAAAISMAQFVTGKPWYLWLGGALFAVFGAFGFVVEYLLHIEWRDPVYLPVFLPYMTLYLGAICFYWWPLGTIDAVLWYAYTALFLVSTLLNALSHAGPAQPGRPRLT
jgi:hypothetical protein